ncbi:MAG: 8-oxo-dGTP diphosphatase MutT [Cellvibrionaceae bacterium]
MKKTVHVAVGIIVDDDNHILIAKRHQGAHQGGLWEFPGGKVEASESVFEALVREFLEEVGIVIKEADAFMEICHDYGDKVVKLEVLLCKQFDGVAQGMEGQELKWVTLSDINNYDFPKANEAIINKLLSSHD